MQTATEARNFLKSFRTLVAFANSVVEADQLEREMAEIAALTTEARSILDGLKTDIQGHKERLKTAKAKLADVKQEAVDIIEGANDEAARVVAEGDMRAKEVKEKAEAAAAKLREAHAKEFEAHQKWARDAEIERVNLSGKVETLREELNAIREKLS